MTIIHSAIAAPFMRVKLRSTLILAVAATILMAAWPASATAHSGPFGDVPDDAYYAAPVAELNKTGVFDGTALSEFTCPGGFCPSEPIDRKTVAVWVVRVLDGHDPLSGPSRFDDVDCCLPAFWSPFIERMAELGVTRGCGDGSGFCPNRNITRAEMAAFLSRAFKLPGGPDPGFSDVPSDAWYAADVARLKASGITVGCGDGSKFCPNRITTRAEMATFLKRAIDYGSEQAFDINDEGDLVPAYALASKKPSSVAHIDIWVHYCGPGPNDNYTTSTVYDSTRLRDAVVHLQQSVGEFYQRESGWHQRDDGETRGSRIVFHEGEILTPGNIAWDQQTLAKWFDKVESGIADPCRIAADNSDVDLGSALFLVPIPMSTANISAGTAGYAPPGGPALSATVEIHGDTDSYLHTVAHEIGHAYYYWDHPWQDEEPPLKYSDNSADQNRIRAQVSEHRLRSIMSYSIFESQNDFSSDATQDERAYVACYQRAAWNWVDENCELPNPRPGQVNAPLLTPGNGLLVASWDPPSSNADGIVRYGVRYRRSDGGTWQDWKPTSTHRSRETTITGLTNDIAYEVSVRAATQHRTGFWSGRATTKPTAGQIPTVALKVGGSASDDGLCVGASCRWLHVEIEGFGPGPHTLACAHEGVEQIGVSRGVYHSVLAVSDWPSTRDCFFGYPGSRVFVVVGAERRGSTWHGGTYSETITWPDCDAEPHRCGEEPDDDGRAREVRISWGSDASDRGDCPHNTRCRNLNYEFIGDWDPPNYTVECWHDGRRAAGPFSWSGRPQTSCYYWTGTAQVIINGVRSNTIAFVE